MAEETRVLVTDGEAGLRKFLSKELAERGVHVVSASSGEEAIEMLIDEYLPVQLILTDVIMSGMSGGELAQRVTAIRPKARVLYMSGYNDDAIVRHGVSDEKADFLQKPFTLDGLTKRVRKILDAPRPEPAT